MISQTDRPSNSNPTHSPKSQVELDYRVYPSAPGHRSPGPTLDLLLRLSAMTAELLPTPCPPAALSQLDKLDDTLTDYLDALELYQLAQQRLADELKQVRALVCLVV